MEFSSRQSLGILSDILSILFLNCLNHAPYFLGGVFTIAIELTIQWRGYEGLGFDPSIPLTSDA